MLANVVWLVAVGKRLKCSLGILQQQQSGQVKPLCGDKAIKAQDNQRKPHVVTVAAVKVYMWLGNLARKEANVVAHLQPVSTTARAADMQMQACAGTHTTAQTQATQSEKHACSRSLNALCR